MTDFRRGFKTEANDLALEMRADLGLRPESPLCPFAVAENLEIPVLTLKTLSLRETAFAQYISFFADANPSAFSAVTVFKGCRRCIVHNHRHSRVRQRSNIAHELAHALLMHPPHPPFCSKGDRTYDRDLEEEAGWLGPVLLVTNEGARWAMANGMSDAAAADHFDVSQDLMRFRFRMSGANVIRSRMIPKGG